LLLLIWILFLISTFFAISPEKAFEKFGYVSKIFLMMILLLSLINTEDRLRLLLRIIALSIGFFALKGGLFAITSGGNSIVWGPEKSYLNANNSIGLVLAMNVPVLLYLSKTETFPVLRWTMRAMLVMSYPAVICTFSRGAWLGLGAITVLMLFKSRRKILILPAACLLAILILPALPNRVVNRYSDLVNYEEEASAQSRLWAWVLCSRVGFANPLHGGGFDYYSWEVYAQYFPEHLEYWSSRDRRGIVWSCHSAWFTILGEHGLLAFSLWLGLIGSCFISLRQIRSSSQIDSTMSWAGPYADMLRLSFVAYVIASTFLDTAYFEIFYQFVATIIIIKEIMKKMMMNSALQPHPSAILLRPRKSVAPPKRSWIAE